MSEYNPEIHTAFRFGIPNAHLQSPSRDSSPDVQAYTSKRLPPTPHMDFRKRLVIAFDIGTASSGISYSILEPGQPIEIKGVNTFPDGKQSSTLSKVPTTIYYDRAGNIRAIGATTLSKDISKFAENNEWTKVKWFKLHLWPRFLPSYESTRGHWSLPANKEAVDILTDYLQYLHRCVLGYLEKAHVNGHEIWRSISADDIRFVFSYPNGWNGVQDQMRKAAVMADLIPNSDAGHARISFVTEGQANLHFVMKHGIPTQITETRDAVVVVVDAGDYMVNISSYVRSASAGLPYEEMTQAQCHLTRSKYKDNLDTMVQYFDRHIKFRFRNSEQPEWLVFGSPSDNEKGAIYAMAN
ncbi:hypothetical protein BDZ97DRAFT_1763789 [Flammula alnicola]|nr:hypothetical protein BDZ97DRAFT_1763789 [Flammula alnicola]